MNQRDLIQTLKNHWKATGISQEELARRVGVRLGTLNKWFNGKIAKMHQATESAIRSYLRNAGALK